MVPGRRRFLRALSGGWLWLVVGAGAGPVLGRAVVRRWPRPRRRRPDDLPPIPWIGHC